MPYMVNDKLLSWGTDVEGGTLAQAARTATMPFIEGHVALMPDAHVGMGATIGSVIPTTGAIIPAAVGVDIGCGMIAVETNMKSSDLPVNLKPLLSRIEESVPAGVGQGHEHARIGTEWMLDHPNNTVLELGLAGRAASQFGTLGSGNHFVEIQVVEEVFDPAAAEAMELSKGTICLMIHSGSRGFGYQICDDAIRALRRVPEKMGIVLPDRQLVCAPVDSPEGQRYLGAMRSAANYAWANRQLLARLAREALAHHLGTSPGALGLRQVYDVAHNIAKMETHETPAGRRRLCVHRKGATRAFPAGHPEVPAPYRALGQPVIIPGDMGRYSFLLVGQERAMTETFGSGHPELPQRYRALGQPVLIPGDMGTASYVLVGTEQAMRETFGSTCHGAGRLLGRKAAIRAARGRRIDKELAEVGIFARARGRTGLAEEQPDAYKNVHDVVNVVTAAGLSRKVARLRPLGVIKG